MPNTTTDIEPDADWERTKNFITTGVVITSASGKLYRVQKVNPANYVCLDENGGMFNVRRTGNVQRAKRQDMWNGPVPESSWSSDIKLGTVVRPIGTRLGSYASKGLWVVIHLNNDGSFKIAQLNGGKNSFLKNALTTELEAVAGSFTEA